MRRICPIGLALTATFGLAACGKTAAPPTTSTPAPAATEATSPAPETPSAPAASNSAPWRPAKCAAYSFTPKDCTGSPENPNCTDSFELRPDGKLVKVFDDIMTRGTFESTATTVTLRVPEMKYEETLSIEDDGNVLVGSSGARYQRADCP